MIRQLIKMLWNQKQRYIGIFIEQMFVFIILMLCMVSVCDVWRQYRTPGVLNTDQTMQVGYMVRFDIQDSRQVAAATAPKFKMLYEKIKAHPLVVAVTESDDMLPYMRPDDNYMKDSISVDNKSYEVKVKFSDENGYKVFKPELIEGQWITDRSLDNRTLPVVITKQLADELKWEKTVGKKIFYQGRDYTVTGMIAGIKESVYGKPSSTVIFPISIQGGRAPRYAEYCVRLKNTNAKKEFSAYYESEFRKIVDDPNVESLLGDMQKWKKSSTVGIASRLFFQSVPTGFLFLFAFIGTFGLFWLYSRQRKSEFALRMAIGSTKRALIRIVVTESLIVTAAASIPGLVLAFFIYDFTPTHWLAIGMTLGIMFLFSAFSAWYPAYQVSRISPAETLHYE